MHLGLALLAAPFAAIGLVATGAVTDSGLAIFTTVAAATILAAFALLWKAIVRVLRDEVRQIVRDELHQAGHRRAEDATDA